MLPASATKARLASSLICRSSMEGWKAKPNWSGVRWKGRWASLVLVERQRYLRAVTSTPSRPASISG